VLVEVHDARNWTARSSCDPLIGINNRNLKTLKTDLATTERTGAAVPPDRFLVSESGLGPRPICGAWPRSAPHCFLVGESCCGRTT
jgi:indole-3-glycerol phosphate synthase